MTRLTVKLAALTLLSASYAMALAANKPNSIKDAPKTTVECLCVEDGFNVTKDCPDVPPSTCAQCCLPGTVQ
jgi:hypothetical protein